MSRPSAREIRKPCARSANVAPAQGRSRKAMTTMAAWLADAACERGLDCSPSATHAVQGHAISCRTASRTSPLVDMLRREREGFPALEAKAREINEKLDAATRGTWLLALGFSVAVDGRPFDSSPISGTPSSLRPSSTPRRALSRPAARRRSECDRAHPPRAPRDS